MALASATRRLLTSHPAITFLAGVIAGLLLSRVSNVNVKPFPVTQEPRYITSIPQQVVSHAPDVKKRVLAAYGEVPHIAQIALSELRPGQVASENWHKDMVEMFVFTKGSGLVQLDNRNHSVSAGSFVAVYPQTRHTIYNPSSSSETLTLLTIAAVR